MGEGRRARWALKKERNLQFLIPQQVQTIENMLPFPNIDLSEKENAEHANIQDPVV